MNTEKNAKPISNEYGDAARASFSSPLISTAPVDASGALIRSSVKPTPARRPLFRS